MLAKKSEEEQVFIKQLMYPRPLAQSLLYCWSFPQPDWTGSLSSLCLANRGLLDRKAYHSVFPVTHASHQGHYKVSSGGPRDSPREAILTSFGIYAVFMVSRGVFSLVS